MNITKTDVLSFLAYNGSELGISMSDVDYVGIDNVIYGVQHQLDKTTLQPQTNISWALYDYFTDGAFDRDYDRMFAFGRCYD